MHKFLKIYLFLFLLFSDFILFAQDEDPGTDFEDETGNTDGTVEAPINGKILWLAIVGTAFAFHYIKTRKDEKQLG